MFRSCKLSCNKSIRILPITSEKELSLCHKLWFYNPYIFSTQSCKPLIFQTINSVRSINLSLKYQRFTPSGCKDIRIGKFVCVAKTQLLYSLKQVLCGYKKDMSRATNSICEIVSRWDTSKSTQSRKLMQFS